MRGFTLIETLLCVAIIGLLAATAVPLYQGAVAKAQHAALIGDMYELYGAFMRYYVDHGSFPTDTGGSRFNVTTLEPLTSSGYFSSADGLKLKLLNNRLRTYVAPDANGPDADFLVIAVSKDDPNYWVYAMHYESAGLFVYDGVYILVDGNFVHADGRS
ncbi:MAG TPA: prepilin-type N-terminal cleavage/methylation domain-containing protein [Candidatus Sulfotelmatobacter sp.]|jgi:general secretion pathway protein G|nr:prepilin-type N-terminal cleavage/methylation domain-containing protein [Candidatus Sulfotelmatobacter sp.]